MTDMIGGDDKVVWITTGNPDHGVSAGVPVGTPFVNDEGVSPWEACGYPMFAWFPTKCRNGKIRWLCGLDRHGDGSYSKSRYQ